MTLRQQIDITRRLVAYHRAEAEYFKLARNMTGYGFHQSAAHRHECELERLSRSLPPDSHPGWGSIRGSVRLFQSVTSHPPCRRRNAGMANEVDKLEASLIPGESSPEQFAELVAIRQGQVEKANEALTVAKRLLLEHIQATGKPLPAGDGVSEWRLSKTKRVKCRNPAQAVATLLDKFGGDLDAVGDCLAANPLKHGAVRSRLEQAGCVAEYDRLFEETWSETAELKKVNTRFLKGAKHDEAE